MSAEAETLSTGVTTRGTYEVQFIPQNSTDYISVVVDYPQKKEKIHLGQKKDALGFIGSERWSNRGATLMGEAASLATMVDGGSKFIYALGINGSEGFKLFGLGFAEMTVGAVAAVSLVKLLRERERVYGAISKAWVDRLRRTPLN